MAPIPDATWLDESDPVPVWVAALALLLVHIAQHRARNRAHANAIRKENGKFIEGRAHDRSQPHQTSPDRGSATTTTALTQAVAGRHHVIALALSAIVLLAIALFRRGFCFF